MVVPEVAALEYVLQNLEADKHEFEILVGEQLDDGGQHCSNHSLELRLVLIDFYLA